MRWGATLDCRRCAHLSAGGRRLPPLREGRALDSQAPSRDGGNRRRCVRARNLSTVVASVARLTLECPLTGGQSETHRMLEKRIVVLANSIKKGDRCVAGREVEPASGFDFRGWIRPVSGESEGELAPRHMRTDDGRPLIPLDIINVPLTRCANDAIHPEDWIVDPTRKWMRAGGLDLATLSSLEEKPDDLWLERGLDTDRVTSAFLLKRQGHQSLYLIRPENFCAEYYTIQYHNSPNPTRRRRAHFSYRGTKYEMNLTDPVFSDSYCPKMPTVEEPTKVVTPSHGDNCLLCVSLTPLFRDYHWKIVATILKLP